MAKSITASVGRMGATNRLPDVKTIQELLNKVPESSGGPPMKLAVTGFCGKDTVNAIQTFQVRHFTWSGADGRVDPGGPTLKKLNEFDGPGVPTGPSTSQPPEEQSVMGTITEVHGPVEVVEYFKLEYLGKPATVGKILHSATGVNLGDAHAAIRIRLTSGRHLAVVGKATFTFI